MISIYLFCVILLFLIPINTEECVFRIDNLRLNGKLSPTFIETENAPAVSWIYGQNGDDCVRGVNQQKYRIWITSSSKGAIVFDTGMVLSNQSTNIFLDGFEMSYSSTYELRVEIWFDNDIVVHNHLISEPFLFGTNIEPKLWDLSDWIIGGNIFRTEFDLPKDKSISRSLLYVTGVGYFKSYLNGNPISSRILDPAWTNYNITCLYSAFEVTSLLRHGERNAIGIEVGSGWYSSTYENVFYGVNAKKAARCILQVFFTNGEVFTLVSHPKSWRTTQGPIIMDSIYNGETYDARLEQKGWTEPYFFNHSSWSIPSTRFPGPVCKEGMRIQRRPPITDHQVFPALSLLHQPSPNEHIFDLGQNQAGVCEIHVRGDRGTKVVLKHAELLNPDGTLYTKNLLTAKQTDTYILNGNISGETYRPTFTYHGFRYVSVTGLNRSLESHNFSIMCHHFHSDVISTGSVLFFPNDHWWNILIKSIRYGQTSNTMGIPTDCPQRDERLGWLADMMLSTEESTFNFDMESFYTNYMEVSFLDVFHGYTGSSDGVCDLPDVVPLFTQHMLKLFPGDVTWTSAFPMMTKVLYQQYGNKRFLEKMYEYLKPYVSFIESKVQNYPLYEFWNTKYGDWCPPPPRSSTIKNYTASFYWIKTIDTMSQFAEVLGYEDDVIKYSNLSKLYRKRFKDSFIIMKTESKLQIMDNSQTAIILALDLNIFDDDEKEDDQKEIMAIDLLLEDIIIKHRYHLNTGIIGTNFLFPVLTRYGLHDVAVAIASRITYPGYGYMFLNTIEPATTLWELWDAPYGNYYMDSRNHIMLGSIASWIYKDVIGISSVMKDDLRYSGYERIRIHPKITNLTVPSHFNASYLSKKGRIQIEIEIKNPQFCAILDEGDHFYKNCETIGEMFSEIDFASFGRPVGRCGQFEIDPTCHAKNSLEVVKRMCIGKQECKFQVTKDLFDPINCTSTSISTRKEEKEMEYQLFVSGKCLMKSSDFLMKLEIPPNSDAIVCLPLYFDKKEAASKLKIFESGHLVWERQKPLILTHGMKRAWMDTECVNFEVGSGQYYNFLMTNGLCM